MRVVKIFFSLVCFGSGIAFAMDAVNALVHVGYAENNMGVSFPRHVWCNVRMLRDDDFSRDDDEVITTSTIAKDAWK